MRIQDLLEEDLIIEDLLATDKAGVIREFADLLAGRGKVRDAGELARAVLEREAQGSTGIGDGIAIPHAKSRFVSGSLVVFGRSRKGVDFQTLDGKPAYLFFLLVSPEDHPGEHLKTLARISRIMRSAELRERLRTSRDRREILRLISDEDGKYPVCR
jgi:fructose-specific phosphotransferase system IIA component